MPHIKTKPFSCDRIDEIIKRGGFVSFRATLCGEGGSIDREELIGVKFEGEEFALEIHKRNNEYLVKPEKSSRPLDANKIKRALKRLSLDADLEIIHDNIALSPTKPPIAERYHKKIEDFESIDFGDRKISIEVGFGSGRHLLYQAKQNPEILYIGIEIHTPSAHQVLKQIELQGIENIWVVNYDARLLLEMLPSNSATMIYVHFPVPWDKKPHRRVVGEAFVRESLRVLEEGGALELRTDSGNYYAYALEIFSIPKTSYFEVMKNSEAVIRSKYEDRWQRMDKDIYTVTLFSQENSPAIGYNFEFEFPDGVDPDLVKTLPRESILDKRHFVHFEKVYSLVDKKGFLVKCSFGSFDRPEHKMIIVEKSSASYYPQPPVKSTSNYNAHQTIVNHLIPKEMKDA